MWACSNWGIHGFLEKKTPTCKIYHWCALQDLLNNLESCDLDDDDLMLDVDVAEDASLHSGMNTSVWVLSATSVVEAATVPSKFLQMETPSPTWLSGEGDNSAGGCRKFMITGGVGFTPIFIKFPPHFGIHQISPVILPVTTRATNWTMLGKRWWPCAGTRTSSWTSARRGDSKHRKTELSSPAVSSNVSAPLTVYKDGWSRRDFTRWFVNALFRRLMISFMVTSILILLSVLKPEVSSDWSVSARCCPKLHFTRALNLIHFCPKLGQLG